jgi:hypothetical protein
LVYSIFEHTKGKIEPSKQVFNSVEMNKRQSHVISTENLKRIEGGKSMVVTMKGGFLVYMSPWP